VHFFLGFTHNIITIYYNVIPQNPRRLCNVVIFRHRLYVYYIIYIATRAGNLSSSPTQHTTICVRALLQLPYTVSEQVEITIDNTILMDPETPFFNFLLLILFFFYHLQRVIPII